MEPASFFIGFGLNFIEGYSFHGSRKTFLGEQEWY